MEVTEKEIIDYARSIGASVNLLGRLSGVIDMFASPAMFLKGTDVEYRRSKIYGKAMRKLVSKIKEEFFCRAKDEARRVLYDERVQKFLADKQRRLDMELEAVNPIFTMKDLQVIELFMDQYKLEVVDLRTINSFMEALNSGVRQQLEKRQREKEAKAEEMKAKAEAEKAAAEKPKAESASRPANGKG